MTTYLIIAVIVIILIYYYYQRPKILPNFTGDSPDYQELQTKFNEVVKVNKIFASFCQNEIGGKDIEEIRTKLNGKKLSQILEENEDYETEVDTLTRTKKSLEADLLAQSNSYKSLIKEKEGMIKRLEKDKKELKEWSKKELDKLNKEVKELKK